MAPRANWKGFLRLSLVSCPVALFPATSPSERIRFNQINRKTGNRIRMHRVDEGSGEEVAYEDIVKGYKAADDQYITLTREELDAVAVESTRTIDIDRFVPAQEIDELYVADPYQCGSPASWSDGFADARAAVSSSLAAVSAWDISSMALVMSSSATSLSSLSSDRRIQISA